MCIRDRSNGINENQIIIEQHATNFGENVTLSTQLLPKARTISFISKPSSLLRVKLTAQAQCSHVKAYVSSPTIEFPYEVSNIVGILGVINEMVGDIERIQKYPELGFQAHHELPEHILNAHNHLIGQGFTEHLMTASNSTKVQT